MSNHIPETNSDIHLVVATGPKIIDCREYEHANMFLNRFRSSQTANKHRQRLNRMFEYIYLIDQLLPSQVDFLTFTEIPIGGLVIKAPVESSFATNFFEFCAGQGATHRVLHDIIITCRMFFDFLIDRSALTLNPFQGIPLPTLPKKILEERYLDEEESLELLKAGAKRGLPTFTLLHTALCTGARPEEIPVSSKSDIDFHYKIFYVHGKTGLRARPLPPGLEETLTEYFNSTYYKEMSKKSSKDYIFFHPIGDGRPLTNKKLNAIIKDAATLAGITKPVTAEWLRRTFANLLYDNGVDMLTLKALMDHDLMKTTDGYVAGKKHRTNSGILNNPLANPVIGAQNEIISMLSRGQYEL